MSAALGRIKRPELFFGFVSPIGADLRPSTASLRCFLEERGYQVIEVKVTSAFKPLAKYIKPEVDLTTHPTEKRYTSYIAYGNQLRTVFQDDSILSVASIVRIIQSRNRLVRRNNAEEYSAVAYILHQFKRKEEIDLLRSVYGPLFFQISVYSRRGARVAYLSQRFCEGENASDPSPFRGSAENIIQQDYDEIGVLHGQRVRSIFHDADFIVNMDIGEPSAAEQVTRLCNLVFGSNSISPTKIEYGMFAAKAAALRSLDLSRQVGAAIFTSRAEIVSLGCNEVPKAFGGTYWGDENADDRDYKYGYDGNDRRKRSVLSEIAAALDVSTPLDQLLESAAVKNSQLMDVLEYGRVVHAEMSAICDAARLGRSVENGVLYCTTFPCHICAKHIVDAGLSRVIFLEPYPKSRAASLHQDSIEVESEDRGSYAGSPAVKFEHFYGVPPRRYRELFERGRRKDASGNFVDFADGVPAPIITVTNPFYGASERHLVTKAGQILMDKIARDHTVLEEVESQEFIP